MENNNIKQKTLRYPEEWDKTIKEFQGKRKTKRGTSGSVSSFIIDAICEKMKKEKIFK